MGILEDSKIVPILLLVLIGVVIFLIIVVINQLMSVHRLKKRYRIFMKGRDGQSLEKMFAVKMKEVDTLEKQFTKTQAVLEQIQSTQMRTLNKYGIVKYDAFDDVGGKMSFALACLDKANTGYILNAIHSRDNCFLYLKEIVKGESYIMLSEEEIEALKRAVNSNLDEIEEE